MWALSTVCCAFAFQAAIGGRVVREDADDLDLVEILEGGAVEVDQFASDDEMKQLLLGSIWHDSFS